jgi:hypothetical protein
VISFYRTMSMTFIVTGMYGCPGSVRSQCRERQPGRWRMQGSATCPGPDAAIWGTRMSWNASRSLEPDMGIRCVNTDHFPHNCMLSSWIVLFPSRVSPGQKILATRASNNFFVAGKTFSSVGWRFAWSKSLLPSISPCLDRHDRVHWWCLPFPALWMQQHNCWGITCVSDNCFTEWTDLSALQVSRLQSGNEQTYLLFRWVVCLSVLISAAYQSTKEEGDFLEFGSFRQVSPTVNRWMNRASSKTVKLGREWILDGSLQSTAEENIDDVEPFESPSQLLRVLSGLRPLRSWTCNSFRLRDSALFGSTASAFESRSWLHVEMDK